MARLSHSALRFEFTSVGKRVLKFNSFELENQLDRLAFDHATEIAEELAEYPPQNPESKYVRTGTLGQSWRVTNFRSGGVRGYTVTNNAIDPRGRLYARYAHGPGIQPSGFQSRRMRAIGWKNVSDYVRRTEFRAQAQSIIRDWVREDALR